MVRSRLPKYLGVGIFWWAHSYTPLNNSFDFFLNFYFEIFFDFFILFFDFFLNFFLSFFCSGCKLQVTCRCPTFAGR